MSDYVFPVLGGGKITSEVGSRSAPTRGASTNHKGIDIGGRLGTPIIATSNQRVTYAGQAKGYGNVVYAVDDNGYQSRYAHLDTINARAGQQLQQGQQLGTLGQSGTATGPNLHYEVRDKSGKVINPKKLLSGAKDVLTSDVARGVLAGVTGGASEAVLSVIPNSLNPFGGEKSWIDQIKDWIKDSGFFQRIALALFAFILLFAAFYLFKGASIVTIQNKAKGLVK